LQRGQQIRGETQVFSNGESRRIRWEPESAKKSFDVPNPSMFDRQRGEDNEDEEEDKQDKDRSYNDKTGGKSSDPQRSVFGSAGKLGRQNYKQNSALDMGHIFTHLNEGQEDDPMPIEGMEGIEKEPQPTDGEQGPGGGAKMQSM
jgi:hypothetical protein